jgi:hypothetical protein
VQEIQEHFRGERARRAARASTATNAADAPTSDDNADGAVGDVHPPSALSENHVVAAAPKRNSATQAGSDEMLSSPSGLRLEPSWVRVLAGHSGAGASTTALAIADAAAAAGLQVQLVETAHPSRSGLVAASSAELGLDESGAWRRGTRGQPALVGQVAIVRRANASQPHSWPTLNRQHADVGDADPDDASTRLVLVDLGLVPVDALDAVAYPGCRVVIACRPTVSGVRLTDQVLDRLTTSHAVIAMFGPRRWPNEVESSAGHRLRALRDTDRVVTVPEDRRLQITGLSCGSLPKAVLAAGRELMRALDCPDGAQTRSGPEQEEAKWPLRAAS